MTSLLHIRELVLKQEKELEEAIKKYLLESGDNIENISNFKLDKNEVKNNIELAINENDLEKAKSLLDEYKNNFGEDVNYYSMQGVTYISESNYEEAFDNLSKGLEIDDKNTDILYNLGYLGTLINDIDASIYYYNECLKNAENLELVDEIEEILKNLQESIVYDETKTIITLGLGIENSKLFTGNNEVICLLEDNNIEYENKYEKDGITICEVNPSKLDEMIDYLVRRNNNSLLVFNNVYRTDILSKFKGITQLAYFVQDNYYLENINYYTNSIKLFLEKMICNEVDFIFTDCVRIYDYKRILERRENTYLLNNNIDEIFTIDYVVENNQNFDYNLHNDKLKEYLQTLDNEYDKSFYLIASEIGNLDNLNQISSYIYEKYNTKEMYYLYISNLRDREEYLNIVSVMLKSEYCREEFKAELVYLNGLEDTQLVRFIIELSMKNYRFVDAFMNEYENNYKSAMYNFELYKKDVAYNKINELLNETEKYDLSPLINRNIYHILYLNGDRKYEKYEKIYNDIVEEVLSDL